MRMRAKYVAVNHASGRGVAERWFHQNYTNHNNQWYSRGWKEVHRKLLALGENPPIEAVAEIVGSKSWSHISCDGCNEYVSRTVTIGDYDRKNYCDTCIREAMQVLSEYTPEQGITQ